VQPNLGSFITEDRSRTPDKATKAPPFVLNLEQVAKILDVHPKTVRLMAKSGKIPGFQVGSLWRFSAKRIHEWIDDPRPVAA
jgi:excisionase family DNA binding protein